MHTWHVIASRIETEMLLFSVFLQVKAENSLVIMCARVPVNCIITPGCCHEASISPQPQHSLFSPALGQVSVSLVSAPCYTYPIFTVLICI